MARYDKRKVRLGKNQPRENSRMVARSRNLRVGDVVRMSPQADRGQDSVYEWLKDRVGVVTQTRPYNWDYVVTFDFTVESQYSDHVYNYNRAFGFWDFDLELLKR